MANRSGGSGTRNDLKVRVKTARGRKLSSTRWLERQLNDPYVRQARQEGYRARAAYKLIEIDDKFRLLRPGRRIVDLGCAPGGWTQAAAKRVRADDPGSGGYVLGVDLQPVDPIANAELMLLDFMSDGADEAIKTAIGGRADVVLSDMAAPATGHRQTDHLRIISLCEAAAYFSFDVLTPGGAFAAKVLQGGAENDLLGLLKQRFTKVQHFKPPASRQDSAEMYVVATGFRSEGE